MRRHQMEVPPRIVQELRESGFKHDSLPLDVDNIDGGQILSHRGEQKRNCAKNEPKRTKTLDFLTKRLTCFRKIPVK